MVFRAPWPLLLVLVFWLPACTQIVGTIAPPVALPPSNMFRAGAAKGDLTPMPGLPMGGHAIGGTIARGYWTRLFARAIYLEDMNGRAMVLVACDVWAVPAGLGDRVAELVQTQAALRHLGREQIVLAATHTHQSPGNFSSAKGYNDFAQRWAGFHPPLFEFLAHRIMQAISVAFRHRQPATLKWLDTSVPGLARNRSVEAFLLNPESSTILQKHATLPVPDDVSPDDRVLYHAVDPRLTLLHIEPLAEPGATIAMAAFVAVHPTSMRATAEVYNSDLFGVAATLAEQRLRTASQDAVVAIFNGALGDISPAWKQQDRRDTMRLGRLLADKMVAPGVAAVSIEVVIENRFALTPLAGSCFVEKSTTEKNQPVERCTAEQPLPGVGLLGGAEDGRSVLYTLGFQEGMKRKDALDAKHGTNQPALDPTFLPYRSRLAITRFVLSSNDIPQDVPLGMYRLGRSLAIATLPGEFTMVMGRRVADTLR